MAIFTQYGSEVQILGGFTNAETGYIEALVTYGDRARTAETARLFPVTSLKADGGIEEIMLAIATANEQNAGALEMGRILFQEREATQTELREARQILAAARKLLDRASFYLATRSGEKEEELSGAIREFLAATDNLPGGMIHDN